MHNDSIEFEESIKNKSIYFQHILTVYKNLDISKGIFLFEKFSEIINKKQLESSKTSIMGRRRSRKKPPPKKKVVGTLETQFQCPFCNHENSCDVSMDKTRNIGHISCRICLEDYQTKVNYLSEPIDVYSDWIDWKPMHRKKTIFKKSRVGSPAFFTRVKLKLNSKLICQVSRNIGTIYLHFIGFSHFQLVIFLLGDVWLASTYTFGLSHKKELKIPGT